MKKAISAVLMVLLVIGILLSFVVGIAALTCFIFMLIIAGFTETQFTFSDYTQFLGEFFWGFFLLGFVILGVIMGIINYFTDLATAFAKEKEAKIVYKQIKEQNLEPANMTEYQKEQVKIHKWHRVGYFLLAGMCIACIIGFTILAFLLI